MIDFDGTDDFISGGSSATIDNSFNTSASISFWLRTDTSPGGGASFRLAGKADVSGLLFLLSDFGASSISIRFRQSRATTPGDWRASNLSTGVWRHIAITYDGGSTANDPTFYINGSSVATIEVGAPAGAISDDSASNFNIGQDGATEFTNGQMEDFRLFNRIITQNESLILANGYRGPLGGEILWLTMMDSRILAGSWGDQTLSSASAHLPDRSNNSNDGTPQGGAIGRGSDILRMGAMI